MKFYSNLLFDSVTLTPQAQLSLRGTFFSFLIMLNSELCAWGVKLIILNLFKVCHSTERKFICPTCSKAFKTLSDLHQHQRRHVDIQNDSRHVECEYCQKKFRTSTDLKNHIRIHTGEKPYKCDQCDYASNLNGNLSIVPYL